MSIIDLEVVAADVAAALEVPMDKAIEVRDAFSTFLADPLARSLSGLKGADLARRNPFVYAALGAIDVAAWSERVVADKEMSSAEGFIGNWLEEVARILSGGFKPGSGADLQIERSNGVIELFAIQSTTNTKNAGGRRSDREGLIKAAGALRAQRRHVDLYVGYLFKRAKTTNDNVVIHLSSVDFWEKVSGDREFLPKLLRACVVLSVLYKQRVLADTLRVRGEAQDLFGGDDGALRYEGIFTTKKRPGDGQTR